MRRRGVAVILSIVLGGCVSAINEKVASNYGQVGAAAQARGDWDAARRAYARSAKNADLAGSDPRRRAIFHYEYERSLGATCFFVEAERELSLAYELDKQAGEPLYLSLGELARLKLDQKHFQKAVSLFERTLGELDKASAEKEAPIAYADILDEYAAALAGIGRSEESATARNRASKIRGVNPKGFSITDRTPYGKHCTKP